MLHRVIALALALTLALLLLPLTAPLPASVLLPEQRGETELDQSPAQTLPEPDQQEEAAPLTEDTAAAAVIETPSEPEPETEPEPDISSTAIHLPDTVTLLLADGTCTELSLEDYLWGVVAAEMPAAFQQEALKAQAVAARSYACYQLLYPDDRHPQADVCTDYACCQAWISREDRLAKWEEDKQEAYSAKITAAVSETAGEVLVYDGQPALAVFHASSGGSTRSAQAVWGEDLPYLVPVSSPESEEDAPNYYSVSEFSAEEFSQLFLAKYPEAELSGSCVGWFSQPETDDSGASAAIEVGGVRVTAQTLRSILSLRSATFQVECTEDTITFHVTGYGHGVGMSQYGANTMAKDGAGYGEILAHYYPGTELVDGGSPPYSQNVS